MGFGIYLVHLLVLDIIISGVIEISGSTYSFDLIVGIFLISVITFSLSYLLVIIIQKIPLLNKIIPK